MSVRVRTLAAALLSLALWSSVVSADPIKLISYDRQLYASALVYGPNGFVAAYDDDRQTNGANTASARAGYSITRAMADSSLRSMMSADFHKLSASGGADADVSGPGGGAQAVADVSFWFGIDQPYAFEFAGLFGKDGLGSWQAHLSRLSDVPGGDTLRFSASSNTGAQQSLNFRGSLDPGRYALFVRGSAAADSVFSTSPIGWGAYNFTFDMSPVPEPGSMALLGTGIVGLIARARRRRIGRG